MTSNVQHSRYWCLISGIGRRTATTALALVMELGVVVTPSAHAQTYRVLCSFTGGTDGAYPSAVLVPDSAGNLYGVATSGGTSHDGTVFKIDRTTGTETVLHSFTGAPDGATPYAGMVLDSSGDLYGITGYGGTGTLCGSGSGCGTVFKFDTTGTETVLYSFTGGADGASPTGALLRDAAGNLYGTTLYGGANPGFSGHGVVFKLDTTGREAVLYTFTGGADGSGPYGGLVRDAAGNLYGTTANGGGAANAGTVFKVDTTGKETVLYTFAGETDGEYPYARLIRDSAGNLYGTTEYGGAYGQGTVFKLDTTGKETVLYSFTGGADGGILFETLVRDASGNLYGTTYSGGDTSCAAPFGCGTVFKLDTTGAETVLYSFTGSRGAFPSAGLLRDGAGTLYGTTQNGGASNFGVVFRLKP